MNGLICANGYDPIKDYQDLSLEELIILYRETFQKLSVCAQYVPTDNEERNLENLRQEDAHERSQQKILQSVLSRPIKDLSEVKKLLEFWDVSVLAQKKLSDYDCSDRLISKSLAFMKAL